jgi:hypothetical protein
LSKELLMTKWEPLIDVPEPSEIGRRMVWGALRFSETTWNRLCTAFEWYEASYVCLLDRLEHFRVAFDAYEASPAPDLLRSVEHSGRKMLAAFVETYEDFKYFADEFHAGRTQSGVAAEPAVSELTSFIESVNMRFSDVVASWQQPKRAFPLH